MHSNGNPSKDPKLELMIDELGEVLYEIGWRPTLDARWDRLKANAGRLQAVLGKAAEAHPCVECGWLKSHQIEVKP